MQHSVAELESLARHEHSTRFYSQVPGINIETIHDAFLCSRHAGSESNTQHTVTSDCWHDARPNKLESTPCNDTTDELLQANHPSLQSRSD